MTRRSRLVRAFARRLRREERSDPMDRTLAWFRAWDDVTDLAAMRFVRCIRGWKRRSGRFDRRR